MPADPIQFTSLEGSEQTGVSVVFKFNQPELKNLNIVFFWKSKEGFKSGLKSYLFTWILITLHTDLEAHWASYKSSLS